MRLLISGGWWSLIGNCGVSEEKEGSVCGLESEFEYWIAGVEELQWRHLDIVVETVNEERDV